jgi:hypothetical protein
MTFRIAGLPPEPFQRFFAMSDEELAAHHAIRRVSGGVPGFPCRIALDDLAPGEEAILLNYEHLPVDSPYRSRHAIYVGARSRPFDRVGEVPPALARRLLSIRAFDARGLMVACDVVEGKVLAPAIEAMLANESVDYIHAHYAKAGCFAARIDRA